MEGFWKVLDKRSTIHGYKNLETIIGNSLWWFAFDCKSDCDDDDDDDDDDDTGEIIQMASKIIIISFNKISTREVDFFFIDPSCDPID